MRSFAYSVSLVGNCKDHKEQLFKVWLQIMTLGVVNVAVKG